MKKIVFIPLFFLLMATAAGAQEIQARLTVSANRVGNQVDKKVFQTLQTALANFINTILVAISAESGLAIIGLSSLKDATLGTMIYWALNYGAIFQNMWWWWLTPVVTLVVLFMALYMVHLGLDETGNPRIRAQA